MRKQSVGKLLAFLPAAFVVIVLVWTPSAFSAAELQPSAPVLEFDLSPNSETGLLNPEQGFEFSVRLKGMKPRQNDELVAIFESLAYPHRLVSFTPDDSSGDLTASTRFDPKPVAPGSEGRPLRMEVVVARLRGLRLESLFSRVAYLTTVQEAPARPNADPSSPALVQSPMATLLDQASATDRFGQPVQPLLLPDDIREESFGGDQSTVSGPVYWKQIGDTVTRRWKQELTHLRKGRVSQGPRVQFKLYPQGFAQLIRVERSSGDPNLDEAALRTVLSLHPFPPFPPDVHEPSVDVHVDLPGPKR